MKKLQNDFDIDIATAHSRLAKKWKNRTWKWSELVNRCSQTKRTGESVREYMNMSREEQSAIKDVGGFVGGYLSGGTRKTANVMWRSVATLDIDYGTPEIWNDFTLQFGFTAMLYSTHKHTAEKPRYRLVFPLNRQVKPYEYEPLCRKIAEAVGIDFFDETTYQLPRLFYWPSTSRDGEFVFKAQDGPACDVDAVLEQYADYRDVSTWPVSSREGEVVVHEIRRVGNPLEKPGLIGAFCRAYTIEDAIETFLSEAYEATSIHGRYTYKKGSVAGGLVCYEGKFAYSNHETDPTSRQLCNAFDLCRIHLYGAMDEGSRVQDITALPSYIKMQEFAAKDRNVRLLLAREKRAEAEADFEGVEMEEDDGTKEADTGWMAELEYDRKGVIKSTAKNIICILEKDPRLAGHLQQDLFSGFDLVKGGLPWNKNVKIWGNRDEANLRVWFEDNYGIIGKDRIKDAKEAVLTKHRVHPIRDYLNSLVWDGMPRLDTLIIDYLGAEDTPLNRAMTRKHFTAAVARVMNPGCKYDYCLIVTGAEGIGKSTLFSVMGGEWFSDSLITMEGTKGMEQTRNGWVIELPELGSINRSDVEQVKAYISRQDDIYRPAYGTVVEKHPRQCVFCGTTNEAYFLKGDTGNRRFWVMAVGIKPSKHDNLREDLMAERDQLWAEAVERWKEGELLYLPRELETEARQRQAEFNDDSDDPMKEMLRRFLDMKLPADWNTRSLQQRRAYINNPDPLDAEGVMWRDRVCAAEFLCECLGKNISDKDYKYLARRVGNLIRELPDWEPVTTTRHAESLYGRQKGYRRIMNFGEENKI